MSDNVRDMFQSVPAMWFIVPGDPVGYYAQGARNKCKMAPEQRKRAEAYRTYQEKVRMHCVLAGYQVPLKATKDSPVLIETKAFFRNGVHGDPENQRKGICDALFYRAEGGDKHTAGVFWPPMYDAENPRVEVLIFYARHTGAAQQAKEGRKAKSSVPYLTPANLKTFGIR